MMNEMRKLKVRPLCIEAVDHENWLFISKRERLAREMTHERRFWLVVGNHMSGEKNQCRTGQ
jgi:hypothetical protein